MTPAINGIVLAIGGSPAASIVAKVTITTALGLLGVGLMRKSRAAVRHAVLAATFGGLLLLPVASFLAPPIRIVLRAAQERIAPTAVRITVPPVAARNLTPGRAPVAARSMTSSLPELLFAGWMAGAALFLLPVLMGLWQVRWLRRSALPWPQGRAVAESLARATGIHRRIDVSLEETIAGPMTYGLMHPAIVLPQDAETWEAEDLDRAITHELEHVRRGDWVTHCIARVICAVYWFHPLVWIALRRLLLDAERSCDDAVLGRSEATAYADQLVGLAKRLSISAKSPLLAMANRADLAKRVSAVLDGRQQRGRAGTVPVALACTAAALLILTISPLTMVAAPQAVSTSVGAGSLTRFTSNTAMVLLTVTVTDQNGKAIEGLTANDFVVTEDGRVQSVSAFEFQNLNSDSSYYTLGYYTTNPNADGQFRKTQVFYRPDSTAKARYRAGYYAMRPEFLNPGKAANANPDPAHPIPIYKPEAQYSDEARRAKWQGTATLAVNVDAAGQVTDVKVVRPLGLGLDEKAVEAVSQWRFRPAMKDGKPVSVQAQVEVSFRLL